MATTRRLRPGTYGIEAILVSLNLRSRKGTLEVVASSDEAPRMTFSDAQTAERLMQEEYERDIERLLGENPSGS